MVNEAIKFGLDIDMNDIYSDEEEVDEEEFQGRLAEVREAIKNDRSILRAIHLFEENKRVRKVVEALNNKDFETFKEVIQSSGNSSYKYLQNIYSNHDEKNQAVSLALALTEMIIKGHGVCRVHGGGFAGTIQAYIPAERVDDYKKTMESVFGENACQVYTIRPYGAAAVYADGIKD